MCLSRSLVVPRGQEWGPLPLAGGMALRHAGNMCTALQQHQQQWHNSRRAWQHWWKQRHGASWCEAWAAAMVEQGRCLQNRHSAIIPLPRLWRPAWAKNYERYFSGSSFVSSSSSRVGPQGGDNFSSLFQVLQTLYSKRTQKHPFLPFSSFESCHPVRGTPWSTTWS